MGYIAFVRKIRSSPKYKEMVEEGYLDADLKKATERYRKDKKFQKVLNILNLRGTEKILEFGCGRAMASYFFAKKGCFTVSMDMNQSKECGLAAIKDYKKFSKVSLNPVAGDIERSPLKDDVFDVVYCNHVLHHATDMDAMVREAARSLKPDGIFIAQSEVMKPPFMSDAKWRKDFLAAQLGANEHLYTTFRYKKALKRAGLTQVKAISLVELDAIKQSKTMKGKLAYRLLKYKPLFSLFSRAYAYFGLPGNPILLYGKKS